MVDRIKLTQGDNLPYVALTLTDKVTNQVINVSDPEVVVRVKFRAEDEDGGATPLLATLICDKVDGGDTGKVRFNFPDDTLNVPAGMYEGEVEIDFDGQVQTVYDLLKFKVRPQF